MRKGEPSQTLPIIEFRATIKDGLAANWNTNAIAKDCHMRYSSVLDRLRRAGTDADDALRERLISRRNVEWERRRASMPNDQPRGRGGQFVSRAA